MKITKKGIIISSVLLSIAIILSVVLYTRYYKIPDKKAVKMELEHVEGIIPLDYSVNQIYVFKDSDLGILVLGADNKLYKIDINEREKIFITGNIPETFDQSLSQNTFILNGEYVGEKSYRDTGNRKKTFKVESWELYNQVDRSGNKNTKSTEYLTKSDYSGTFTLKTDEKDLRDVE